MSSDSDDDYSYTNSVSVLRALTKKNVSLDSDIDNSRNNEVNFFDISQSGTDVVSLPKSRTCKSIKETKAIGVSFGDTIEIEDDDIPQRNNASCIVVSDEEVNVTPLNIISTIDNVLNKVADSARGRGRRKRKSTDVKVRRSKRLKPENDVVHISQLNSSELCIVEDSPDLNEVNYELTVKVFWKSQYVRKFTMRRFEKLTNIFQYFSEKEDVPENRLLFTIKDTIISKYDTPDNLNITAATIIEGGVLSANTNLGNSKSKGDQIELKIQMKDNKHPMLICLRLDDRMDVVMFKCAQELDSEVQKLKFFFDGELIKSSDTPRSLELEGGEIIDCIKKYN